LHTGKEVQQMLIRVASAAMFEELLESIRDAGEPPDWTERDAGEPQVPVPSGPIAQW